MRYKGDTLKNWGYNREIRVQAGKYKKLYIFVKNRIIVLLILLPYQKYMHLPTFDHGARLVKTLSNHPKQNVAKMCKQFVNII